MQHLQSWRKAAAGHRSQALGQLGVANSYDTAVQLQAAAVHPIDLTSISL